MEEEFPEYTPVVHVKDGYVGWIYDITTSKAYFTGDTECDWQYRVWVGEDDIRIAPQQDLKINYDSPPLPPFIEQKQKESSRYKRETSLHALGYQITDMSSDGRWIILLKVAVPYLGVQKVIKTIVNLMYGRSRSVQKNRNALYEWNYDLDRLLKEYDFSPQIIDQELLQYIINTKKKLIKYNIKMEVTPEYIQSIIKKKSS